MLADVLCLRSQPLMLAPLVLAVVLTGCYDPGYQLDSADEPVAAQQQTWDSQDGNPTHATHSYMSEFALDQLKGWYPQLQQYRAQIVDGSNRELHELPVSDPEQEALRVAVGGTNWACDRPAILWDDARAAYSSGDRAKAWWYVGIVLHFVQDMGAPAHAFHVVHQASVSQMDNFEFLALQRWAPYYDANRSDPVLASPADYIEFGGAWTVEDFQQAFPGKAYTRTMFATSWLWAPTAQKNFVRNRQGRGALATQWALLAAVAGFARL